MTSATDEAEHARRVRLTWRAVLALLVVLGGALAYRQLVRAADANGRERRQSLRQLASPAPRGVIYDRERRVLAGNRIRTNLALDLGLLRPEFRQEQHAMAGDLTAERRRLPAQARLAVVQRYVDRVNLLTNRSDQVDVTRLEKAYSHERTALFVIAADLSDQELAPLGPLLDGPTAPRLVRESIRSYPHGRTAAHALGRVQRQSERFIAGPARSLPYETYTGLSGLEKQFDAQLRGQPALVTTRVDAWGFPAGLPLQSTPAKPGADVVTSLDLDVQLAAEQALAQATARSGAAVAIAVDTGEVLALASKPDFDPGAVSLFLSNEAKRAVDATGGWFNRAHQGLYPPGSAFKFITAAAALRTDAIQPHEQFVCEGSIAIGGRIFACHHAEGHGALALRTALARSCNVFAIRAALAAGPDALAHEARRFHLDAPTGIDLPAETSAMLVPNPAWKGASGHGDWAAGDTANFALGQGYLRISPLQAACAVASLARRETLTVPTLLHQPGRRPSGDRPAESLGLLETDYAALVEGLRAVVETGIGRHAQVPGVSVAGKSGTAQVDRPGGRSNVAWFIAFAPVENPAIAVAVALEGGQPGVEFAGAEHAAPIAREMIATYLEKSRRDPTRGTD